MLLFRLKDTFWNSVKPIFSYFRRFESPNIIGLTQLNAQGIVIGAHRVQSLARIALKPVGSIAARVAVYRVCPLPFRSEQQRCSLLKCVRPILYDIFPKRKRVSHRFREFHRCRDLNF